VFLDRDGVVNRAPVRDGKPYPPATVEEVEIPEGTAEALAELKAAGFLLIVVTNQPDVARGTQAMEVVEAINARLAGALPLDAIRVCAHGDEARCNCRKPAPGLILDAAAESGVDLGRSYMIGDRWRDVDAGAGAGCRTVLIDYGYRERGPSAAPDYRARDLWDAVRWILADCAGERRGSH
jgi:D-glycero-D-manno-heptose 1,7-bisphosphate phosphatase